MLLNRLSSFVITHTWKKQKLNVPKLTFVVAFLHRAESANTFSSSPGSFGHWSMSTFWRSISIPLVPLKRHRVIYNNQYTYVTQTECIICLFRSSEFAKKKVNYVLLSFYIDRIDFELLNKIGQPVPCKCICNIKWKLTVFHFFYTILNCSVDMYLSLVSM